MKYLIAVLVLLTSVSISTMAQDDKASTLWAVHHITPKSFPMAEISKRIFDHDDKFHEGKSAT